MSSEMELQIELKVLVKLMVESIDEIGGMMRKRKRDEDRANEWMV